MGKISEFTVKQEPVRADKLAILDSEDGDIDTQNKATTIGDILSVTSSNNFQVNDTTIGGETVIEAEAGGNTTITAPQDGNEFTVQDGSGNPIQTITAQKAAEGGSITTFSGETNFEQIARLNGGVEIQENDLSISGGKVNVEITESGQTGLQVEDSGGNGIFQVGISGQNNYETTINTSSSGSFKIQDNSGEGTTTFFEVNKSENSTKLIGQSFSVRVNAEEAIFEVSSSNGITSYYDHIFKQSVKLGGTEVTVNGSEILAIQNTTNAPTTGPASGGNLWVEQGALKYIGSGGTITTIANA